MFELNTATEQCLNPFRTSSSYKPNPLQATGKQIKEAFLKARSQCGYDYRLLSNNCQTFARLFMLALGAKHERQLMHP